MVVAALVMGTIVVGCVILALLYVRLQSRRLDTRRRRGVSRAADAMEDDILQVLVLAHDQEAELEIQFDGFDSYEELRELVVDAVPQMFNDSDAILMEYADGDGGWTRVKTKTPVHVVKKAGSVRIKCQPDKISKKIARQLKKAALGQGNRSGFERVRSDEL